MSWAWGIDLGSTRAGFCFLNADTGTWQTNAVTWRKGKTGDARSLIACREHVIRFSTAMLQHFPPATICYEAPTGKFPKPTLGMHAGVTIEAVTTGTGLAPWPVPVASWKKKALGSGNVDKEAYLDWAMELGCPDDADQAAALGVAVYAACEALGFDSQRLVANAYPEAA